MITPQAWSLVKLLINNLYTIKRPWSFPVLNLVKWLIFNLQSTKRLLGKSQVGVSRISAFLSSIYFLLQFKEYKRKE